MIGCGNGWDDFFCLLAKPKMVNGYRSASSVAAAIASAVAASPRAPPGGGALLFHAQPPPHRLCYRTPRCVVAAADGLRGVGHSSQFRACHGPAGLAIAPNVRVPLACGLVMPVG